MKLNKSFFAAILLGATLLTGCSDDFATLNQDKAAVTTPNAGYLFAQAVNVFEPSGYLYWFYNSPMTYSWSQMGVSTGGMTTGVFTRTATGDQGDRYINTLRYVRDIENYRSTLSDEESAKLASYQSATEVLTIYLGLFDSDMYGNLSYTEACRAAYGGPLTPEYDSMESLYNLWLEQLDTAIKSFQSADQTFIGSQDVVYNGDLSKWAKFANSLKLRIAVRLIAQNMAKAKQIAAEVTNASCGYIDSIDDDVLFNKAQTISTDNKDVIYHWSNGFLDGTAGTQNVINFMVDNLDPRVRFCYQKNNWNSKIVQAYYDRDREIPDFIEKNVNYTTDANGKKTFVSWKGAGEPWVRYYGIPMEYNSQPMAKYDWYFRYGDGSKVIADANGQGQKSYRTFSYFQQMMVIGRTYSASVPTAPGDVLSITSQDRPWYGLYLGAAEVNLYLAEFAMLNNNEAAAKTYYEKALEISVQEYDKLAGLNKITYYGTTYGYDPNEKVIDLVDGEIETMMESDAYAFTGTAAEKMEKIYVQQLLNFTLYPNEQYVTARRSGYPKIGSNLLPRESYSEIPVTRIPRRFDTGLVLDTDLMYEIKKANIASQGFTQTSAGSADSEKLHDERIWADKNAPEWGAGHNY
ncbi:SusD/RagB family nutrient-binding outer membrane lipoprotein [Parabacteroides sp. OttesenSCG-928-G06]|nr:SusD/RagB family nutrient-binding outer membrane lipoprotein [Parabacteroides sp. OttesenSCG-928-G06]